VEAAVKEFRFSQAMLTRLAAFGRVHSKRALRRLAARPNFALLREKEAVPAEQKWGTLRRWAPRPLATRPPPCRSFVVLCCVCEVRLACSASVTDAAVCVLMRRCAGVLSRGRCSEWLASPTAPSLMPSGALPAPLGTVAGLPFKVRRCTSLCRGSRCAVVVRWHARGVVSAPRS
jgi:hypothetical protein